MTNTVKRGVMALMIEDSPTEICVWPAKISENGRTLLSSPMPRKGSQSEKDSGKRRPMNHITGSSAHAASDTRSNTTVRGGSSRTATPAKK